MTKEPCCTKCGRYILASACSRLECPRQSPAQQAEVRLRWKVALARPVQAPVETPPGDAATQFAAKGWGVRRALP